MTVFEPATRTTLATVPVGKRSYGVAFDQGRACATNQCDSTISVISRSSLESVATQGAGDYSKGIDTNSDGFLVAFVNMFDKTLSVIDATALEVIEMVDICDGPRTFGTFQVGGGDS